MEQPQGVAEQKGFGDEDAGLDNGSHAKAAKSAKGTELKPRNMRNTRRRRKRQVQSLAATGRERWQKNEGKKINAERRERGERRTEFLSHG
jgi:hypothetical protein